MQDKTCLVTGATSGIGLVTARAMASMGAKLVIVGRNQAKTEGALAPIRADSKNPHVEYLLADFAVLDQVRDLAHRFRDKHDRLDVLVNNAGSAWPRRQLTVDGHEMNFGVNHLAPFLLTRLVLDKIKGTPEARMVNVSSAAHRFGSIDFDDLTAAKGYGGYRMYARSKLMNLLFTFELARQLSGTGVKVNAVHPGWVATGISHNFGWQGKLWWLVSKVVGLSPEQGARTLIYLASSPELQVTGQYFARERPIAPSAAARDDEAARRLWRISMEMTDKWA